MEYIIHRVNKIKDLKLISKKFGAEIDIRSKGSKLILNHEPFSNGDSLKNYLDLYQHKTLVLNLKEAGIEKEVLKLVNEHNIKSYFLLDVEMPYMYAATKALENNIAVRFSEYENISLAKYFIDKLKWIWIDTATKLPINKNNLTIIKSFKSCIVCPERWGRKNEISKYKKIMKKFGYKPDAVMTSYECIRHWSK